LIPWVDESAIGTPDVVGRIDRCVRATTNGEARHRRSAPESAPHGVGGGTAKFGFCSTPGSAAGVVSRGSDGTTRTDRARSVALAAGLDYPRLYVSAARCPAPTTTSRRRGSPADDSPFADRIFDPAVVTSTTAPGPHLLESCTGASTRRR
jgi:hypothetical protein